MSPNERAQILGAKYKNKSALYQPKAHYMEQTAMITTYGVSCLWISHEHAGRDGQGGETVKTSITDQERLKFHRNVNLILKVRWQSNRYGVEVEEARNRPGLNGKIYWDEPGNLFRGMWRQIADDFYAAEVVEWDQIMAFASDRQAADLALEQNREVDGEIISAFKNVIHARNALKQIKEKAGDDPVILAKAWKKEVAARLQAAVNEHLAALQGEGAPAPTFDTLEDLLFQLNLDFGLKEAEAKAKLKGLGFTGWPTNGGARQKSTKMYLAVKAAMDKMA